MSHWRPTIDWHKYQQAILFILTSPANNRLLGKVKLFKLLYYLDFDHYQTYKLPITGDMYRKLPYGPVPRNGANVLSGMVAEGLIDMTTQQVGDYTQYVFKALHLPHTEETFSKTEIEVLYQVCLKWANHSTNEIVTATHGEAPWLGVEMGDEIPYSLAFYRRQLAGEGVADDEEAEAAVA
jgi:uncharacterized phage-associated protein